MTGRRFFPVHRRYVILRFLHGSHRRKLLDSKPTVVVEVVEILDHRIDMTKTVDLVLLLNVLSQLLSSLQRSR